MNRKNTFEGLALQARFQETIQKAEKLKKFGLLAAQDVETLKKNLDALYTSYSTLPPEELPILSEEFEQERKTSQSFDALLKKCELVGYSEDQEARVV